MASKFPKLTVMNKRKYGVKIRVMILELPSLTYDEPKKSAQF